jgi:class 3 adenylate cyclase
VRRSRRRAAWPAGFGGSRSLPLVKSCPACGFELVGSSKFCPECGTTLTTAARVLGEERKVVTALFCDLVGFTASSELADPEDVDQMLNAYFAMARRIIESFGGVVEKFIGDAVVGVFGVPAAHEDDPERAVRAGLRIVEEAERLSAVDGSPLRLRVGINTGEALVRLGVGAGSGERFLAGDAINTASRIQSLAPEMGVAVGLATYEATSVVFEYEELGKAQVKGKAELVRVFNALAPRARFGTDLTRTHDSPFVGREIDLALLKGGHCSNVVPVCSRGNHRADGHKRLSTARRTSTSSAFGGPALPECHSTTNLWPDGNWWIRTARLATADP